MKTSFLPRELKLNFIKKIAKFISHEADKSLDYQTRKATNDTLLKIL